MRDIDSGTPGPLAASLVVDVILLSIFAIQHSVMARQGFKRWWTKIVPPAIESSTYVLFASLALVLLYWKWMPLTKPVWTVTNPAAANALEVVFWIGWAIATWSVWSLIPLGVIAVIYVVAALGEERKFSRTEMADAYADYRRQTGFFWPRLPGVMAKG